MSTLNFTSKDKMLVELGVGSSPLVYGFLYVSQHGRLQDILNDDREFLPFENVTGQMKMLRKATITSIEEIINVTAVESGVGIYHLLGVSPQGDMNEIEDAYHSLIRRCHPDMFAGDKYPPELRDHMDLISKDINARFTKFKKSKANNSDT